MKRTANSLVFVDDQFGGLHINAGVHRQSLDKGGEGFLLLLVGQLNLLDELVQPQADRGIRDLVESGDVLQGAGFEHKIFEESGVLRFESEHPLGDFIKLQFNSPFIFGLIILNIT